MVQYIHIYSRFYIFSPRKIFLFYLNPWAGSPQRRGGFLESGWCDPASSPSATPPLSRSAISRFRPKLQMHHPWNLSMIFSPTKFLSIQFLMQSVSYFFSGNKLRTNSNTEGRFFPQKNPICSAYFFPCVNFSSRNFFFTLVITDTETNDAGALIIQSNTEFRFFKKARMWYVFTFFCCFSLKF